MTELHDAIVAGDLARVESVIKSQSDLNQRDAAGRTPLHRAIELKHDDIALALIENGADASLCVLSSTEPPDGDGMNALHWAASCGRTAPLRAILDLKTIDINSLGSYHERGYSVYPTPALVFSLGGDSFASDSYSLPADCAFALLDAGADPNVSNLVGATACISVRSTSRRRPPPTLGASQ